MMKNNCAMNIAKEGSCETIYLNSYAEDLSQACEALTDAKAQVPQDKSQIAQLTKDVQQIVADFDRVQLDNSFNLKVDGVVGTNDFFPQTDNTQWLQGRGDN